MHLLDTLVLTVTAGSALLGLGCAGEYPPPTQRLSDVQSANRSAMELGAKGNPKAELYLKLSQEQLHAAQAAVADGDNRTADRLLKRANADAELAVALVRDSEATRAAQGAVDDAKATRATDRREGATP